MVPAGGREGRLGGRRVPPPCIFAEPAAIGSYPGGDTDLSGFPVPTLRVTSSGASLTEGSRSFMALPSYGGGGGGTLGAGYRLPFLSLSTTEYSESAITSGGENFFLPLCWFSIRLSGVSSFLGLLLMVCLLPPAARGGASNASSSPSNWKEMLFSASSDAEDV